MIRSEYDMALIYGVNVIWSEYDMALIGYRIDMTWS